MEKSVVFDAFYSGEQVEEIKAISAELDKLSKRISRLKELGVELGYSSELHIQINPDKTDDGYNVYGSYVGSSDSLMHLWSYALDRVTPRLIDMSDKDGRFCPFGEGVDYRDSKGAIEFLCAVQLIARRPELLRRFIPVILNTAETEINFKSLFVGGLFPEEDMAPPKWTQLALNGRLEELIIALIMGGHFEPSLVTLIEAYNSIMVDQPEEITKLINLLSSNYEKK